MPAETQTARRLEVGASGYWYAVWAEKEGGVWRSRRVSARTKHRAVADAFLRELLGTSAPATLRVSDVIDQYLASRRHVGETQRRCLETVRAGLGHQVPGDLTPAMVVEYGRARGVSDATLRRDLGALVACLHWGEKTHLIPRAPYIDLPPAGQPRDAFLDEQQEAHFHAAALAWSDRRVGAFVALALDTAARKTAILDLTWKRVDLVRLQVDYRDPDQTVTRKRRVPVPVSVRLEPVLRALHAAPIDTSPYVLGETCLRHAYERFAASVGMSWVTPHVLRHTAATLMLRAGHSLWEVGGVLGDTPETISRVYAHHTPNHLRRAVSRLGT